MEEQEEEAEVLTVIYLHSLAHYSSHPLQNMYVYRVYLL